MITFLQNRSVISAIPDVVRIQYHCEYCNAWRQQHEYQQSSGGGKCSQMTGCPSYLDVTICRQKGWASQHLWVCLQAGRGLSCLPFSVFRRSTITKSCSLAIFSFNRIKLHKNWICLLWSGPSALSHSCPQINFMDFTSRNIGMTV